MTSIERVPPLRRGWGGPVSAGAFLAGVAAATATAASPYPRPGSTPEQISAYFQGSARAARISVAGQLVSAAALLPYGESVAALAAALPRGRRLAVAARIGSTVAAATLATSALTTAALTGPAGRSPERAAVLHRRAFLAGGPLHTAAFGLLTGVLGIAGWRSRRLPRPLAAAAGASAVAGLLSPSYLVSERTVLLIPAGRFSALLLAAAAGALLTARRRPT
jgi:hypothetical protein